MGVPGGPTRRRPPRAIWFAGSYAGWVPGAAGLRARRCGGRGFARFPADPAPVPLRRQDHVSATFNARAETVADKPMFREAFKQRRCIIPASEFFEWTGDRYKQPHLFTAADGSLILAFAACGTIGAIRRPAKNFGVSCRKQVAPH
jgi:hypothetical protein